MQHENLNRKTRKQKNSLNEPQFAVNCLILLTKLCKECDLITLEIQPRKGYKSIYLISVLFCFKFIGNF